MSLKLWIGSTQLADGSRNGSSVEEIRDGIAGTRAVQIEEAIRAGEPTFFDRQTVRNELTFSVRKQVTGYARALHLALTTRQDLAGTGRLKIELEVGGVTHRWTAQRAAWTETQSKPMGASVQITYRVTCGTIDYETDDEEEWAADEIDGGETSSNPTDVDTDGGAVTDNYATTDADGGTLS